MEAEVCWNSIKVVCRLQGINCTKKITGEVEIKTEAELCIEWKYSFESITGGQWKPRSMGCCRAESSDLVSFADLPFHKFIGFILTSSRPKENWRTLYYTIFYPVSQSCPSLELI